ncbi:hypothetical protein Q4575_16605 [Psychrosphaera sp. 1_MG-2023]|uniref:hypothetical protein n=1 Tax=Psychrosphaera sp. 1_MG-2023 TaxID=3062643 RepID=UPI0026E265FD|nr:hypothetical protein [Psychrosphaera sp. 1_MG-2023]MDO6721037.1 hypothetical protein [Psychrosphaera sp. 1_MG-2023]
MYYLIEHNRTTKTTECDEYNNYIDAQNACLLKEQQFLTANKHEMEVVVFEANSLADLKQTHSRYFVKKDSDGTGTGTLVAVGLVGLAAFLLSRK